MKMHFIGIGGIGVSALARYYLVKGHQVSGSDLAYSEITRDLESLGARIFTPHQNKFSAGQVGHSAKNLPEDVDLVIHSVAIQENNPELKKAKELGVNTQTYPQVLGKLTKKHFTIAVSGAHGKGTTTAMISLILIKAGLDPTVIIGTNLKEFGNTNCRIGKSKYLIVEADEYRQAFLNYWPKIIVVTNIDKEHLDCFKDLYDIIQTFKKFISHLPKNGVLIVNKDNKNINVLLNTAFPTAVKNVLQYSLKQKEARRLKKVLKIPGEHNVSNALAAMSVAKSLEIPDQTCLEALSQYQGAWRRFEIFQAKWGPSIISDYAHHPAEIRATLQGVCERFPKRKVWAIFQPHQHQRTYYLFDEFVRAFDQADEVVITKIYSVVGREKKDIAEKVSARGLAENIQKQGKHVHFIEDFLEIPAFLKKRVNPRDVILIMGAGSIYKIISDCLT